jgi:hypothetical protein
MHFPPISPRFRPDFLRQPLSAVAVVPNMTVHQGNGHHLSEFVVSTAFWVAVRLHDCLLLSHIRLSSPHAHIFDSQARVSRSC